MSASSATRYKILLDLAAKTYGPSEPIKDSPTKYFAENMFDENKMRDRLPKSDFIKLQDTIKRGEKLDMTIANAVAHAMKEWAISKGVSHFTHWFQPQTGLTAEKHDAFLEIDEGHVIERFRGNQLVQGEPDASSFPSGGARTTFEARGYTMWDPSSPAFIIEGPKGGILCIPTVFISYTGEALDKKTPLLRSMGAISQSALKVLRLFGNTQATRVITTIGTEQEYFLIDKAFYNMRPDLQFTGRTLIGAQPPKGQQLEDHYFGSIKERVLAFMQDAEWELYKLGVPAKTRHNEVAPHQFEIAPIYAEANLGADRNQLIMEVLKKVANRHNLALLLHEKPFAGINGSGKHNNWSMEDSEGNNLLDPGDTPEQNLQFLVFLVATLRAVHQYGDLLRMSIAAAGNDHRLGANEAPPAIISVFLGKRLTEILNNIKDEKPTSAVDDFIIDLGLGQLPSIMRDNTDRNRTSPFAFTGAKFEFRAIGSSASVSFSNTVLSAAVADSIDIMVKDIEEAKSGGKDIHHTILKVLQKYIIETEPIRFEGNNYSKEWEEEAARRNLPNIKRTGYALNALMLKKNVDLLTRQKVYSRIEIESRFKTRMEQYILALEIEAETFCIIALTHVLPAAIRYQKQLADTISGLKSLGKDIPASSYKCQRDILDKITRSINQLHTSVDEIKSKVAKGAEIEDLVKKGKFFSDNIFDLLESARIPADQIESILPDDLWPLPKYSEMLFIM